MITIFCVPKPFEGAMKTIQHNAVQSWVKLRPPPEVILFGDEDGTAETAAEFMIHHIPDVKRNEYGTPLLNDLFKKAQKVSHHTILCYVNADIMLMSDFMRAIRRLEPIGRFLMVGQRWDVDMPRAWDFSQGWEGRLKNYVKCSGKLHGRGGSDFFAFSRGLWGELPPFAIGRYYWDCWLIYRARALNAILVDATRAVTAVHQSHGYGSARSKDERRAGPEARRNLELAGGTKFMFTTANVTHVLTSTGLRPALEKEYLIRRVYSLPVLCHSLEFLWPIWQAINRFVRRRLKLLHHALTGD